MKVIITKRFPFKPYHAITLYRWIFVREDFKNKYHNTEVWTRMINHENIHLAQIREVGLFTFYGLYLWYWVRGLIKLRNNYHAYKSIPFEQEAYRHARRLDYLQDRQPFKWKDYLY